MISYGKPEYIEELKTMWQKTFGDSKYYIDSFFDNIYESENTLVYVENDHVVSALYMIPYKIIIEGTENNIVYLYALATAPDFRGRNIMSTLITMSIDICAERNYVLSVLVPAEDSLFGFYKHFGFEECFEQVKITKSLVDIKEEAKDELPIKSIKANAKQIWNIYSHSKFFNTECIILSEDQNEFYINLLEKEGGEALLLKTKEMECYALLKQVDDNIVIYETNVDSVLLKSFYATLLENFDFKTVTFYQPICFNEDETNRYKRPFAMSKSLKGIRLRKPFLNRVLM